jgi:hypothetical protein
MLDVDLCPELLSVVDDFLQVLADAQVHLTHATASPATRTLQPSAIEADAATKHLAALFSWGAPDAADIFLFPFPYRRRRTSTERSLMVLVSRPSPLVAGL